MESEHSEAGDAVHDVTLSGIPSSLADLSALIRLGVMNPLYLQGTSKI